MSPVMIANMTRSEIESSYHTFDESQLLAACTRLLELMGD